MPLAVPARGVWQAEAHSLFTLSPTVSQAPVSVGQPTTGSAYPTSDLAIYVPIRIKQRMTIVKLFVPVSTASGNIDVGIYTGTGARVVSAGTTAAALSIAIDITDTVIGPGLYYAALVADNTSIAIVADVDGAPSCAAYGVLTEQLGAGAALPATATWAVDQTLAYYPGIALMLEPTVA